MCSPVQMYVRCVCVSVFKCGDQRITLGIILQMPASLCFWDRVSHLELASLSPGHGVPGICLPFCPNPGITSTLLTELSLKDLHDFCLYVYFRFCLSSPNSIVMCYYRHSPSATAILCFLALWILHFYNFLQMESRRFFCLLSFTWHSASRVFYALLWVDGSFFSTAGEYQFDFYLDLEKKIYLCRQKVK